MVHTFTQGPRFIYLFACLRVSVFCRPAADHVHAVRLVKPTKNSPDKPCTWRMGDDHTIHARRMETATAVVGALLVALIALGRTSQLTPLRDTHRTLIVCTSSHFPEFSPSPFPVQLVAFRSRTFIACSRFFHVLITNPYDTWVSFFSISDPRLRLDSPHTAIPTFTLLHP